VKKEEVIKILREDQEVWSKKKRIIKDFEKDDKTMDAVIRNIEILGGAVKNISKSFREKYSDVE